MTSALLGGLALAGLFAAGGSRAGELSAGAGVLALAGLLVAAVGRARTARLRPAMPLESLSDADLAARLGSLGIARPAAQPAPPEPAPTIGAGLDLGVVRQRVLAETILALTHRSLETAPDVATHRRRRVALATVWLGLVGTATVRLLGPEHGLAPALGGLDALLLGLLGLVVAATLGVGAPAVERHPTPAVTDPATGLRNLRGFRDAVGARARRATRDEPWSIALIDLDDLALVNARLGRTEGDRALGLVVSALCANIRREDVVARYGDDEFVVFFDHAAPTDAERILRRVAQGSAALSAAAGVPVSFSAGIAGAAGSRHSLDAIIARAEAGLRQAKASGKRAVRIAVAA